jgi:hypothetical protein
MNKCKFCGAGELPTIKQLRLIQVNKKLTNIQLATLTELDKGLTSRIMRGLNDTSVTNYFKIKKAIEDY